MNVSHPLKQLVSTDPFLKPLEGILIPGPAGEHVLRNYFSILVNDVPFKYVVCRFTPLEWVAGDDISFDRLVYNQLEPNIVSSIAALVTDRVINQSLHQRLWKTSLELGELTSGMRSIRMVTIVDSDN